MTEAKQILVTGATGYIGGRLVPLLLKEGHHVRCMARQPERLVGFDWPDVEIVAGDALDKETLKRALCGIDVAYYLIHSLATSGTSFEERDRQAAQNFGEVAAAAGVKRIIYLGGLGSKQQDLSAHLSSRHEVGDWLRASGIPVTEFRAAIIVGSGSVSFEIIRYLTERLPVMICPRWLDSRVQPIAVRDVLAYLVQALNVPASAGETFEIGGTTILTYGEMIQEYAAARGLKRKLIHVPVLTPRLSSYWIDLVTPIPAAITRPLVEGLRNDVICEDTSALQVFPIHPLSYKEALQLALIQ